MEYRSVSFSTDQKDSDGLWWKEENWKDRVFLVYGRLNVEDAVEKLHAQSLLSWRVFAQSYVYRLPGNFPKMCDLFTTEPPHSVHLGTSKLYKQCAMQ